MAAQAQAGQCAFASLGQAGGPLPMGPSPDAGTPGRDFTWSGQGPAPVGTAQPHSLRQRLSSAGRPSHFTGPTCRSLVGGVALTRQEQSLQRPTWTGCGHSLWGSWGAILTVPLGILHSTDRPGSPVPPPGTVTPPPWETRLPLGVSLTP